MAVAPPTTPCLASLVNQYKSIRLLECMGLKGLMPVPALSLNKDTIPRVRACKDLIHASIGTKLDAAILGHPEIVALAGTTRPELSPKLWEISPNPQPSVPGVYKVSIHLQGVEPKFLPPVVPKAPGAIPHPVHGHNGTGGGDLRGVALVETRHVRHAAVDGKGDVSALPGSNLH